jgi:acyl dehydratase
MSDELQAQLDALCGPELESPGEPGRDPVNQPMIRHWCDAMDDVNPVYTDRDFAEKSVHGGIVAPPTMLQSWTMRGLRLRETGPSSGGPLGKVMELVESAGYTSVVATNCRQEYSRYVKPGDHLSHSHYIESVSPEKQTALGTGRFVTQIMVFCDQAGEEVARMVFRILKFKPGTGRNAAAS